MALDLQSPAGAPAGFQITLVPGAQVRLEIAEAGGRPHHYRLPALDQPAFLDLFEALARDIGLRAPHARLAPPEGGGPRLEPVLTAAVSPRILYGYGDPCVVRIAP